MNELRNLYTLTNNFFDKLHYANENDAHDNLTFKVETETFLRSGRKEDAFTVFFCYSEIFKTFGVGYENTKKLLETLADHEYHSGVLLNKHRDHYSHSAYVFALGLAIYDGDGVFRKNFLNFYHLKDDHAGRAFFLKYWGMTALFHDVGYPFQLVHEQFKTYAGNLWSDAKPFVTFGNVEAFIALSEETATRIAKLLSIETVFPSIDALLAYGVEKRLGYDAVAMTELLASRVKNSKKFLDHGYFSAIVFAKQIFDNPEFEFNAETLDVLSAILLHNSLNKREQSIEGRHPIDVKEHPLAYLICLCDELQSWDRLAYGKASKEDPIAWDAQFAFTDDKVEAVYYFVETTITDKKTGKTRYNKSFNELMTETFVTKIFGTYEDHGQEVMGITSNVEVVASPKQKAKTKKSHLYASDDNFINLCDFARAINESYNRAAPKVNREPFTPKKFEDLSLHYKVDNIKQAKTYAYKLELINCFYSNKDLDYPVITEFENSNVRNANSDDLGFLAREEHLRWVQDKLKAGFVYGTKREGKKHPLIVPYEELERFKNKKTGEDPTLLDIEMIKNIPSLLQQFDSDIKIYNYRSGHRPTLEIAGIGHRFFRGNIEEYKRQIKTILQNYENEYRVVVRTGFAYGADQLIAECANELGITVKAVLPRMDEDILKNYEMFIEYVREDVRKAKGTFTEEDELRLRHLLAQTVVCKPVPIDFMPGEDLFRKVGLYILNKSQRAIMLWDREPSEALGGTYDCYKIAITDKKDGGYGWTEGKELHIIQCTR